MDNKYIVTLESASRICEPAILKAMRSLNLQENIKILDVPCGIGNHMQWMLEEYPSVKIAGIDIDTEHIEYAKSKLLQADMLRSCTLNIGDMNKLNFVPNSFDLIWCCDGLWPGPKEFGCVSEKPYDVLSDLFKITKNSGIIALLFWSSHKLLPGYPYIESTLNATKSANLPFDPETNPELHFMCAPAWMKMTGLKNVRSGTFTANIQAPLREQEKKDITILFDMLWGQAEREISEKMWGKYKQITHPESDYFILNDDSYAGFITYTMFTGVVNK